MTTQDAEIILKVNNEDYRKKYDEAIALQKKLRTEIAAASKAGDYTKVRELGKELGKVGKELKSLSTNAGNIRAAMKRLDEATPKELKQTIKQINAELNSGRVQRGSKEWQQYVEWLQRAKNELNDVKKELGETGNAMGGVGNAIKNGAGKMLGWAAAATGMSVGVNSAIEAFTSMDAEMANVRKYSGLTAEQVEELNEEFKKMDTRTSREDLNRLAQEAGRLGKSSKEDILGFVRAADQINVALDDLGEGATLELSKLTQLFGDEAKLGTEKALLSVGSVVNELSQSCSASAPYITDFATRLGGVGAQAGMTSADIMAFGAILDTTGMNVEAASTALQQVIVKMLRDPAKFAKAAGLDVKEFSDLCRKDMNAALLQLLETCSKTGGMAALAPMFADMGEKGANSVKALSALASKIDEVKEKQELATQAFADATSVSKEVEIQNNTAEAKLEKAKKQIHELVVELGAQLYPIVLKALGLLNQGAGILKTVFSWLSKHKTSLVILVSVIAAYNVVMGLAAIKTAAMNLVTKAAAMVQGAYNAALALGKIAVIAFTEGLGAAKKAFQALNTTMKSNVFGLVLSAVAAVIVAIEELTHKTDDFSKTMDDAKAAAGGFSAEAIKEKKELDDLFEKLRNCEKGSADYESAKQSLLNQYGRYMKGLVNERGEITNLTTAYNLLAMAVERTNALRGIDNAQEELNTKYYTDMKDTLTRLQNNITFWTGDETEAAEITQAVAKAFTSGGYSYLDNKYINRLNEMRGLRIPKGANLGKKILAWFNTAWVADVGDVVAGIFGDRASAVHPGEILLDIKTTDETYKENTKIFDIMRDGVDPYRHHTDANLEATVKGLQEVISSGQSMRIIIAEKGESAPITKEVTVEEAKKLLAEYLNEVGYRNGAAEKNAEDLVVDNPIEYTPQDYSKGKGKGTQSHPSNNDPERERQQKMKAELDAAVAYREHMEKILGELYLEDLISYQEYQDGKEALMQAQYNAQLKILENYGQKNSKQAADIEKAQTELQVKEKREMIERIIEVLDKAEAEEMYKAQVDFYDPTSDIYGDPEALYARQIAIATDYILKRQELFQEGDAEYEDYQKQYAEKLQELWVRATEKQNNELKSIREKYLEDELKTEYETDLAILESLHKAKLISEEEFQKAKKQIQDNYNEAQEEQSKQEKDKLRKTQSSYADMVDSVVDSFKQMFAHIKAGTGNLLDDLAACTESIVALMDFSFSQATALNNANRDLRLAELEKYYKAEIEKVEGNNEEKERLEKEKQQKTAAIKKKYNDRAMKIELAQAVAQGAQAAIAAYASAAAIPFTGWIMAPIAAALAATATGIQIAVIKKQHQTEELGYYEGGFTGGRDYRKKAGIVHGGEFVANHYAVNNPALSPLFRLLDNAQKNNSVGRLTSEDVSIALGQGRGLRMRGAVSRQDAGVKVITNAIDTKPIEHLGRLIENGIETYAIIDGEQGLFKKMKHYEKIINNPKP